MISSSFPKLLNFKIKFASLRQFYYVKRNNSRLTVVQFQNTVPKNGEFEKFLRAGFWIGTSISSWESDAETLFKKMFGVAQQFLGPIKKMASAKTNKIKKRTALLYTNF